MGDAERDKLFESVVNKLDILEQLKSAQAISDDRIKRIQTDNDQHRLQLQAISTQMAAIGSDVRALCAGCDERHKRISDEIDTLKGQSASTRRWLGKHVDDTSKPREDVTGPVAIPQNALDVVKMLDKRDEERDEAAAKKARRWGVLVLAAITAVTGSAWWKSCSTEEALRVLAKRPPQVQVQTKTQVLPPGPGLPIVIEPDARR